MVSGYHMEQPKSKNSFWFLRQTTKSACLLWLSGRYHRVPLGLYLRKNPESFPLTANTNSTPSHQENKTKPTPALWSSEIFTDVLAPSLLHFKLVLCLASGPVRAGEKKWGTDEVKFLTVLCSRNRNHLLHGKALAFSKELFERQWKWYCHNW